MPGTHSFTHLLKPQVGSPVQCATGRHRILVDGFNEKENGTQTGSQDKSQPITTMYYCSWQNIFKIPSNQMLIYSLLIITKTVPCFLLLLFFFVHTFSLTEATYLCSLFSQTYSLKAVRIPQKTEANLVEECCKRINHLPCSKCDTCYYPVISVTVLARFYRV